MKPFLPVWAKDGNQVLSRVEDIFVDRLGNQALIEYVYWKDKKGKQHKSVAWVRWE